MEFFKKSVDEFGDWLRMERFSDRTVELFKENEVDGEAFLLMTDKQLKFLVKAIGAQMKLIKRRDKLNGSLTVSPSVHISVESADSDSGESGIAQIEDAVGSNTSSLMAEDSELLSPISSPQKSVCKPRETCTPTALSKQGEQKRLKLDTGASIVTAWTRMASKKKQELGLPMPFDVPRNFQPHVQAGLDSENLTGKARAKFITSVAEAVYRYKSYPTRDEYEHVAHQLVKKWEFLETRTGHGYLVEALRERMAYLRKPDGQKRGARKNTISEPKKERNACKPSSPLLVEPPPCEDRASHDRHLNFLKKECRNVHPNKQITQDLTKRTFPYRRQDILDGRITTQDIFSIYPTLKCSVEIVREFDRIMGPETSTVFINKWKEMVPEIIKLASLEQDNHRIQSKFNDIPDSLSEDGESILALYFLCYLLPDTRVRPDHCKVLTIIEEGESVKEAILAVPTAQPCIIVRGQLGEEAILVIEKKSVTTFNPKEAPLLLLGAFYTFNMHYTEGCSNFYTFFEVVFLGKQKPVKLTRLSGIIARLNRSIVAEH